MFVQELQIHREVSHQSRLQAVLIKVTHVRDAGRHSLFIFFRVEFRDKCGLVVTTVEESYALA